MKKIKSTILLLICVVFGLLTSCSYRNDNDSFTYELKVTDIESYARDSEFAYYKMRISCEEQTCNKFIMGDQFITIIDSIGKYNVGDKLKFSKY